MINKENYLHETSTKSAIIERLEKENEEIKSRHEWTANIHNNLILEYDKLEKENEELKEGKLFKKLDICQDCQEYFIKENEELKGRANE